jgi:leader peptidase (prepilin peptidase)/N-methyltransferase
MNWEDELYRHHGPLGLPFHFWTLFIGIFGAMTGSFLNVVIHRMPREESIVHPPSHCPTCNHRIPMWQNMPIFSWLMLRGRCASCRTAISPRYIGVEALTGVLFVAAWLYYGESAPWAAASASILLAGFVAATFIDFEHFIIPDEITWGGAAAGVIFSALVPEMMDSFSRLEALAYSLGGSALGFGLLFLVVEGGKLAFGKIRHAFPEPEDFEWRRQGDRIVLKLAGEELDWMDIFSRERDVLTIEVDGAALGADGAEIRGKLKFWHDRFQTDGISGPLDQLERITGKMKSVVIPREAMGFGDVKFIACIGAFLGWQAVLFTLFAASIIGSIAGFAGIALARDRAGVRIPFGPFLALGALLWLFGGKELMEWYLGGFRGAVEFF